MDGIFKWFVEYHATVNLEECLPRLKGGRITDNQGNQLTEGADNKTPHDGLLLLKNGDTLLEKLVIDDRIDAEDVDSAVPTKTQADFADFLKRRDESDGVFVYESARGQLHRVCHVYPISLGTKIEESIPPDFVNYRGNGNGHELRMKLGTKTRLAIELPKSYPDIDAYQIKRSAYTPLGMGKVTHFNRQGLVEEFFMMYNPESEGPFIDQENKIVGIYRRYERDSKGKLVRVEERQVGRQNIGYLKAA